MPQHLIEKRLVGLRSTAAFAAIQQVLLYKAQQTSSVNIVEKKESVHQVINYDKKRLRKRLNKKR